MNRYISYLTIHIWYTSYYLFSNLLIPKSQIVCALALDNFKCLSVQWTHGPTLMPGKVHLHTSATVINLLNKREMLRQTYCMATKKCGNFHIALLFYSKRFISADVQRWAFPGIHVGLRVHCSLQTKNRLHLVLTSAMSWGSVYVCESLIRVVRSSHGTLMQRRVWMCPEN